jgi:hypothetical protein
MAVLGTLLVALSALSGVGIQALSAVVVITLLIGLVSRIVAFRRGTLVPDLLRTPRAPELRWHRWQLAVRVVFIATWVSAVLPLGPIITRLGASGIEWGLITAGVVVLWVALALVQTTTIPIATNVAFAMTSLALLLSWATLWWPAPTATELSSPVARELFVVQGGDSPILNHHYLVGPQRYALDLLVLVDGRVFAEGTTDDLLAKTLGFGTEIVAPAAGRVVHVVDGIADDAGNVKEPAGNQVIIRIAEDRYVLLAHLKNGTVAVAQGDEVAVGDRVGALGNSGNSSMPHLHIQVQSRPALGDEGNETFPIAFRNIGRVRRGDVIQPTP